MDHNNLLKRPQIIQEQQSLMCIASLRNISTKQSTVTFVHNKQNVALQWETTDCQRYKWNSMTKKISQKYLLFSKLQEH